MLWDAPSTGEGAQALNWVGHWSTRPGAALCGLSVTLCCLLQCPAEMASDPGAEPDAEDAAEAEEGVYEEVMPCDRMELSQRLAVEELITTEASYVHNIQLCVLDIRAHLQKKQVRQDTSPYPGAGDRSMNLLRAARCPKHCREVATCSPSTSLVSFSQLEVLGWVDIGSDPVQPSYGFNPSSVT